MITLAAPLGRFPDRLGRAARLALVGVGGAVAFGAAWLTSATEDGPVLCVFRRCTGGYCPGCGMTRATGSLLRGDLGASIRHHPYLVVLAVQVMAMLGVWALASDGIRRRVRAHSSKLVLVNVAALLVVWLVRMALGHIPAPFT